MTDKRLRHLETMEGTAGGIAGPHDILSITHTDSTPAAVVRGDLVTGQGLVPTWTRLAVGAVNTVLTSDGTDAAWQATAAVNHNLLSAVHPDTVVQGATRGSLIYGNATPRWDELNLGGISGSVLTRDATDVLWSTWGLVGTAAQTYTFPAVSGNVTLGAGTLTAATVNDATIANHTHAITDTADGDTNVSTILSSGANGELRVRRFGVGMAALAINGTINISASLYVNSAITVYNPGALGTATGSIFYGDAPGAVTGTGNIGIGLDALDGVTNGTHNIGIGYGANNISSGNSNIGIGNETLQLSTTTSYNIGIGCGALRDNRGSNSVAVGQNAMWQVQGSNNVAVGYQAYLGQSGGVTGANNVAVGYQALYGGLGVPAMSAANCVAVGYQALFTEEVGNSNVGIGYTTGYDITSGGSNTLLGTNTGRGITTGSGNSILGASIGGLAAALTNNIILASGGTARTTFDGTNWNFTGNIYVLDDAAVGVSGDVRAVFDSSSGFIELTLGDAAGADEVQIIDSGAAVVATIDSDGTAGFGTSSPDRRLHAEVADAETATITYVTRKSHTTSGTAAALYGVGHEDELEDSAGNMQVASEQVTLWSAATTAVESPLLRWTVYPKGTVGPGYKGLWGFHDVDDTARTAIANGTGDVTAVLLAHWVIVRSDASVYSGDIQLTPGSGGTFIDFEGEYILDCAADGSVTVVRDAGATTADVMLDLLWI